MTPEPKPPAREGATVVITHRVRDGREGDYERWLEEISPISRSYAGFVDWQIVRPIAGLTSTYTVILRFQTEEQLRDWMGSEVRSRLIARIKPALAQDDDFFIRSGLDFWFTPEQAKAQVPIRWKQFLVTWSAIFPLVLFAPWVVMPMLRAMGIPQTRALDTLVVTGLVVATMVYVVMPRYTRLLHRWLFAGS